MTVELSAAAWAALTSETRLQIVQLCGEAPRSAHELAEILGVTRANIMRHLEPLVSAGVVWEVDREAVRGGPRLRYGAADGWTELAAQINVVADRDSRA